MLAIFTIIPITCFIFTVWCLTEIIKSLTKNTTLGLIVLSAIAILLVTLAVLLVGGII